MAFKIITADDPLEVKGLVFVLYGEPGIGKTSLAFTAEKPLLEDFDDGVKRSVGRKSFLKMDKWEDVIDFHTSQEFKGFSPGTIIIDTAGTMLDNYVAQYVIRQDTKNARFGGELSLQGYGAMKGVFRQFVNSIKSPGIDLIFICHSEAQKEGDSIKFIPKMTGGSYDILISEADMVGYMESRNNRRTIQFNPTDRNIGKNTAEFDVISVPHYAHDGYSSFVAELIAKTKARMLAMTEQQNAALKLVEEMKSKIVSIGLTEIEKLLPDIEKQKPAIKTNLYGIADKRYAELLREELAVISRPEEADQYFSGLKNYPERYKETFKQLLWAQAREAGLDFDKREGKFIKKGEPAEDKPRAAKRTTTNKAKDEAVSITE